jgi:hypothetical protein
MAARLGRVIYWVCCGIAVLFFIAGIFGLLSHAVSADGRLSEGLAIVGVCWTIGAVVWAVGRACRYVLAAE